MILSLVYKEWKSRGQSGTLALKLLRVFGHVLAFCAVFATIAFLYTGVDERIESLSNYPSSDVLILYLFIALVLSALLTLGKARSSLFTKEDRLLLTPLPITDDDIIISKCFYLYMRLVIAGLMLFTPALIGYAVRRPMGVHFYIFSVLYPFVAAIPALAIVGILVFPYKLCYDFLKERPWLQILLAALSVVALCFLYQYVLDFFLETLLGSRTDITIAEPVLEALDAVVPFLTPAANYFALMTNDGETVFDLLMLIGIVIALGGMGYFVLSALYRKAARFGFKKKEKEAKPVKLLSPTKALIRKEGVLLFRNSNYLFSFTSLLIMQPFLCFVVLSSLSEILYTQMLAYVTYFPELTNGVSLLIILLFSSLIGGAGSDGYTREDKGRVWLSQIPVSPLKEALIKAALPFLVSVLSLFVSDCVLLGFGLVNLSVFFSSLFIGTLLIASLSALGLYNDSKKFSKSRKAGGMDMSFLFSVGLPLLVGIMHFALVFLSGLPSPLIYLVECLFALVLSLPAILGFFLYHRRAVPVMKVDIL